LKLAKAFACLQLQVDDCDAYGAVYLLEDVICGSSSSSPMSFSGEDLDHVGQTMAAQWCRHLL
jgi:hypothetical protein